MLMDDVSNLGYGEAYDAIDSDYTTIVEPSVMSIPALSNAPESPLKDFALSLDSLVSLEQAEATSRNRARVQQRLVICCGRPDRAYASQ